MPGFLRQSTAATVKLGPFLSPADALTVYSGSLGTVKLSKEAGALAARGSATAIAYDADGYFDVPLSTTDTNTLARLKVEVAGSAGNYLPVWDDFTVLSAAVYDVLFGTVAPSTYAGADTAGTTTLLARVGGALTISGGKVAATVAAGDGADSATAIARLTATRAGYLDNLATLGTLGFAVQAGSTAGSVLLTVPATTPVSDWVGRDLYHVFTGATATISAAALASTTATVTLGSGWPTPTAGNVAVVVP